MLPNALRGPAVCVYLCVCLCVCERERGIPSYVSGGKFYFEKIIAIFSGSKNYYMYGEKLPYLSSDQADDIPTYMHQKILSCNKLDNTGENASKICCLQREDAFWLLD